MMENARKLKFLMITSQTNLDERNAILILILFAYNVRYVMTVLNKYV